MHIATNTTPSIAMCGPATPLYESHIRQQVLVVTFFDILIALPALWTPCPNAVLLITRSTHVVATTLVLHLFSNESLAVAVRAPIVSNHVPFARVRTRSQCTHTLQPPRTQPPRSRRHIHTHTHTTRHSKRTKLPKDGSTVRRDGLSCCCCW